MYEQFYNFTAEPFRLSPDPRFCYRHTSFQKAHRYMQYALRRAEGFVMVTGSPGTGKSTLVEDLVTRIGADGPVVARLISAQLGPDDLLRKVGLAFGLETEGLDKATLLQRLEDFLLRQARTARSALLIVDEAQGLTAPALEALRLLTNLQQDSRPLLQIFLVGQEELRDVVRAPGMEQFHQRLIAACHLRRLDEKETRAYIAHRLQRVSWKGDPRISGAALALIHRYTRGVPRRINQICSRLLLHGAVEEKRALDRDDVLAVIEELKGELLAPIPTGGDMILPEAGEPAETPDALDARTVEAAAEAPGSAAETAPEPPAAAPAPGREPPPGAGAPEAADSPAPSEPAPRAGTASSGGRGPRPQAGPPARQHARAPGPGPGTARSSGRRSGPAVAAAVLLLGLALAGAGAYVVRPDAVTTATEWLRDLGAQWVSGPGVAPLPGARPNPAARPEPVAPGPGALEPPGPEPAAPEPAPPNAAAALALAPATRDAAPAPPRLEAAGRPDVPPAAPAVAGPGDAATPQEGGGVGGATLAERAEVSAAAGSPLPAVAAPDPESSRPVAEENAPPAPGSGGLTRFLAAADASAGGEAPERGGRTAGPAAAPLAETAPEPPPEKGLRGHVRVQASAGSGPGAMTSLRRLERSLENLGLRVEPAGPGQLKANLRDQVPFAFDSAAVSPDSRRFLDELAEVVLAGDDIALKIVGYADPSGPPDYNLSLSARRAAAVGDYLVARGVPAARITREGRGAAAASDEDGAYDDFRRIELYVTALP